MRAATVRAGLGLLSMALFAALLWYGRTYLSPDGLDSFDGRPLGYTLDQTREYLRALGEDGRQAYLGPVRALDTAFPIVFACFLAMMLHNAVRGWALVPTLFLMLLPGAYLLMDLTENALVAELLQTELRDLRAGDVQLASHFTVTKYVVLSASVLALIALSLGKRK